MKAQNIKTGKWYKILATNLTDATNDSEKIMVLYKWNNILYCRERSEFYEKFNIFNSDDKKQKKVKVCYQNICLMNIENVCDRKVAFYDNCTQKQTEFKTQK